MEQRPVERLFAAYSADHTHPLNQRLHLLCVPLILAASVALLHAIPVGRALPAGSVALFAGAAACVYWLFLSPRLGVVMTLITLGLLILSAHLAVRHGNAALALAAGAAFLVGWIGQFWGHVLEGRRPSFLTDLTYLLVGPLWVLAKLLRPLGLRP
ncbi:MAG: hypothetical protein RL026_2833 [Pseudomonadota bacterium]|jgi:uncharacterized membrane protein YGL010W